MSRARDLEAPPDAFAGSKASAASSCSTTLQRVAPGVADAVSVLERFPRPRCAVQGDLRELGADSARLHREVGATLAGRVERLVTVGEDARAIASAAIEHGLAKTTAQCVSFADEAASLLVDVRAGTVLVKGSRAVASSESCLLSSTPTGRCRRARAPGMPNGTMPPATRSPVPISTLERLRSSGRYTWTCSTAGSRIFPAGSC